MPRRPSITTARTVDVFEEALSVRRDFCKDDAFFKMPDLWEHLCEDSDDWTIKTFKQDGLKDHLRQATVIAFAGRYTLVADEKLMLNARKGCWFSNFTLAHEAGHLMLDHHNKTGELRKHFKLYDGPSGLANIPPNDEELETNYAAAFLQCGVQLFDRSITSVELARRAFCDPTYVAKAQRAVRLGVFRARLTQRKASTRRVIL